MVCIDLDPNKEKQLKELAASRGEDTAALLRRVIEDYLDFAALPVEQPDENEQWGESSVAMAPEFINDEPWDEDANNGSR